MKKNDKAKLKTKEMIKMATKKKDFTKQKKYIPLLAIIGFIVALDVVGVVDVKGKVENIFSSKAGSKAIDSSEGKNLDAFLRPNVCPKNYPWGPPKVLDETVKNRSLYFCGHKFASQFDPMTKVPIWTHEFLSKTDMGIPLLTPLLKEPILNDAFPDKMQSSLSDYVNSEYVPGFMASVENMKVNDVSELPEVRKKRSEESIKQGFYLTNSIPMNKNLSNNLWLPLDAKIRRHALDFDKLYVITGPVYLGGQTLGLFGVNKVAIPTHFYKVITEPNFHETMAYIIPNRAIVNDGSSKDIQLCSGKTCTAQDFIVNIKEVEKLVGMQFYPVLGDYYASKVKK